MKRRGRVPAAEPLARALRDHHRDGRPRRVTALRADGLEFEIETEEYFTLEGELAALDRLALDLVRGRVLDVGAGAGRHALAFEARGCEVVAIDVSPICVALCRERGVRDAREYDVLALPPATDPALGRFDTIFFGMQTLGVAGAVDVLSDLLARLRAHLAVGGCVVADSSALRFAWEGEEDEPSPGRGEIVLETRYGRLRGEPFAWLYLAEEELAAVAARAGFDCEILGRVADGEYLARLSPGSGRSDRDAAGSDEPGSLVRPGDRA